MLSLLVLGLGQNPQDSPALWLRCNIPQEVLSVYRSSRSTSIFYTERVVKCIDKKPWNSHLFQAEREPPEQCTEPGLWNSLHHRNGTACNGRVCKNQFTSNTHRNQTAPVKIRLFNELFQSLNNINLWACSTETISVRVSHGSLYSRVAFCSKKMHICLTWEHLTVVRLYRGME